MTKLSYVRLFCDRKDCDQTLVLRNPGSAHQIRLAAARHGWLVKKGELCPGHRVEAEESTGSTVAQ